MRNILRLALEADKRPYRQRAEILIHHSGKVLVTKNKCDTGFWYGLPGGGIEEGQTPEQAAIQEALEEVGVKVTNVRHSNVIGTKEGYKARDSQKSREEQYRGSQTHLIEADYAGVDKSQLAHGDDATDFIWVLPAEAVKMLSGNSGPHQKEVLQKYI